MSKARPIAVTDLPERRTIAWGRDPRTDAAIVPSFQGQDPAALLKQVPYRGTTRPMHLDVVTIPRGCLLFGPGVDGVAFTADGRPVRDTAVFHRADPTVAPERLRAAQEVDEDWVSVIDCAWDNHFHLLTLALPKLPLALAHLPGAVAVLPARRTGAAQDGKAQDDKAQDGPAMLDQLLALSGHAARVRPVADGLYRPRNLHLIWPNHGQPAALHVFDAVFDTFETLARAVPAAPDRTFPQRIFIERVREPRLVDARAIRSLDRHLARHGFEKLRLETLDMADQIRLFRGATHVVAAHGAGLSNIVFGRPTLRVLELNSDLDGQGTLRPWFLLLAAMRGQHYQYLDASACELADLPLGLAFDRLMGTNRQGMRLRLNRLRRRFDRAVVRLTGRA